MDQAVIDKVRKLLARGDEARNDNPHEREIAMRHAHAIMAKHGLQIADIGDETALADNLGRLGRQECGLTSRYVWEAGVWDQIAKLHGSMVVRSKKSVWIVGRELRAEVIKGLARWCVTSISMQAVREHQPLASFGSGAWSGLAVQVNAILANMAAGKLDGETLSTSTALVLVNQHKQAMTEAKATAATFWTKLKKGKARGASNGGAYSAGYSYGSKINLNGQLGHTGQRRIGGAA